MSETKDTEVLGYSVMSAVNAKISKLNYRIDEIQHQIEHINFATDDAITKIESQKKDLRGDFGNSYPVIKKNIQQLILAHEKIVGTLMKHQDELQTSKVSLELVDFIVCELDREISRIQADRDRVVVSLMQETNEIKKVLSATGEASTQMKQLDDQIKLLTLDHNNLMQNLQKEKQTLLKRNDLPESDREVTLAKLDRTMQEAEDSHRQNIESLQRQQEERMSLLREYESEGEAGETTAT